MSQKAAPPESWEPRILAFVCRWCTYAGADLAGTSRLKYPPNIRIVKLPCSGRIDPLFLLRGFETGADGILVSGCHPGDCHYTSGNYYARRRWVIFRELLTLVGLEPERLHFSWVSAAEGGKFVEVVKKVTEAVRSVGPFPGFAAPADQAFGRAAATGTGSAMGRGATTAAGGAAGFGAAERTGFGAVRGATAEASAAVAAAGAAVSSRPGGRNAAQLTQDLESGAVRAILGRRAGRRPGSLQAGWAKNAAAVQELRYSPGAQPNLAGYLLRRLREEPEGVYGILAGPNEAAALEVLIETKQVDADRVHIYRPERDVSAASGAGGDGGAGGDATGGIGDAAAIGAGAATAGAAVGNAAGAGAHVSAAATMERHGIPGLDRPSRERWDYWTAQFAECIRCYACREACPLCSCVQCVEDKTRPRWIDSSPTPAGNWIWNITRAFHQAGRCVDCGGCTEACPAGIPLEALNRHLREAVERAFPRPEGEKRSPLLCYTLQDEAPFIM